MIRTGPVLGALAVLVLLVPGGVRADSGSRTYEYFIGAGPLCALAPDACPVVARSTATGDNVEVSGTGTLTIHPKSVTGGGTFTHKDAVGGVVASGSWTAEEILSFAGYGTSPGLPSTFEGGKILMRVHLTSAAASFDAVMQVDCLIGKFPAGAEEGIRLNVQDVLNFNKEVSGLTLYIRVL